jgi:SAM-dependent methyltransferase
MANGARRPTYGVDSPLAIRNLLLVGAALTVAGALATLGIVRNAWVIRLAPGVAAIGVLALLSAASMIGYALCGKFRVSARILGAIAWRGDEVVLDVGTGLGLLLIGAAKRLVSGHGVGIDLWRTEDLAGNALGRAQRNVSIEGVANRVGLLTRDVRELHFSDESFDVVLSLCCLQALDGAASRRAACGEIARVLRPGGVAVIAESIGVGALRKYLTDAGLRVERPASLTLTALTPLWMLRAEKPASRP